MVFDLIIASIRLRIVTENVTGFFILLGSVFLREAKNPRGGHPALGCPCRHIPCQNRPAGLRWFTPFSMICSQWGYPSPQSA